jgi:hypothetical protein
MRDEILHNTIRLEPLAHDRPGHLSSYSTLVYQEAPEG